MEIKKEYYSAASIIGWLHMSFKSAYSRLQESELLSLLFEVFYNISFENLKNYRLQLKSSIIDLRQIVNPY